MWTVKKDKLPHNVFGPEGFDDQFFKVLTGVNKSHFSNCLQIVFSRFESGAYEIEKEIFLGIVKTYFNDIRASYMEDDDDLKFGRVDDAHAFLNKLLKCGWCEIIDGKNFSEIVRFNDFSIDLINMIVDSLSRDSQELLGNIFNILQMLMNFDDQKGFLIIEAVFTSFNSFKKSLAKLETNIKNYTLKIYRDKKMTPDAVVEDFFGTFIRGNIDRSYFNLKLQNNPYKIKTPIINRLDAILSDEIRMSMITEQYIHLKDLKLTFDEAKDQLIVIYFEPILEYFQNLDKTMNSIDEKMNTHITLVINKINFQLTNKNDSTSLINNILKHLIDNPTLKHKPWIPLYDLGFVNEASFFTPRARRDHSESYISVNAPEESVDVLPNFFDIKGFIDDTERFTQLYIGKSSNEFFDGSSDMYMYFINLFIFENHVFNDVYRIVCDDKNKIWSFPSGDTVYEFPIFSLVRR